ncbi:MAG: site-specific integrase [Xanthobacteraceae bacterium]
MSVRKRVWTTRKGETKEAWIADFTDGTGKRHIRTFKQKKPAEAYEASVTVAVNAGTHVALDGNLTVANAAEDWIKRVEANGMRNDGPAERATVRQYCQHMNLHIVPRIGKLKLAKLTKKDVENFRDGLLKRQDRESAPRPMSRAMAAKVLTSLKSLLKVAGVGHIAADVTLGTKKRDQRKLEIGRDIPTTGEIKRLIGTAKNRGDKGKLQALLLTAALTGLRASELRGLRWSDIDLKAEELHVRQRADRYNNIGAPKTKESARAIPLPPDLLLALKQWKLACPKSDGDLVFPTSTGAVDHHKNMLRGLAPVMKAAGVVDKSGEPKYALHSFRHFFASWCINPKERGGRELPIKVAQTLLGHASVMMTLDRYGHLFPSGNDRTELADASRALLA